MKSIIAGNQYSLSQIGNKLRIFNDRVIDITNLSLTITPSAGLTLVSIEAIGDESFSVDTWTKPSLTTMTDLLRDVTVEVTDDTLEDYYLSIDFTYDEANSDRNTDDNVFDYKLNVLGCGTVNSCFQLALDGLDNVDTYPNFASFPAVGTNDVLYIDRGQSNVYYWDGSDYVLLSTNAASWGNLTGDISNQADLISLISSSVFSGSYDDLTDKPTLTQSGGNVTGDIDLDTETFTLNASVPAGTTEWGDITGTIGDQTDLTALISSSAFSGDYDDLTNKPTLTQSGGDVTGSIDLDAETFTLTAPAVPDPTVSTDATITGDGSVGDPLGVANEFTALEKSKLSGIEDNAQVNVQSDWNQATNTEDDYIQNKPTNLSDFNDDIGASDNDSSIFSQNVSTGDISHQSDSGAATTTAVIKSTDAGNLITTGSDGGNLLLESSLPVHTITTYESVKAATGSTVVVDDSLSVGSSVVILEAGTYLINWGFYGACSSKTAGVTYIAALTTAQDPDLSGGAGLGVTVDKLDIIKQAAAESATEWQNYQRAKVVTIPSPNTTLYITLYSPAAAHEITVDNPSVRITAVKL